MPRLLRQQLLLLLLVMTSIYGRFDRGPRPRGGRLLLVLVPVLLGHRGLLGADAQASAPQTGGGGDNGGLTSGSPYRGRVNDGGRTLGTSAQSGKGVIACSMPSKK